MAREQGWVNLNTGLIPGMAGVAVPVFDAEGRAVAALSIGTLAERLRDDRLAERRRHPADRGAGAWREAQPLRHGAALSLAQPERAPQAEKATSA